MALLVVLVYIAVISALALLICMALGIDAYWGLLVTVPMALFVGYKAVDWEKDWENYRKRKR